MAHRLKIAALNRQDKRLSHCSKCSTRAGSELLSLPARTGDRAVTTERGRELNTKLTQPFSPRSVTYMDILFQGKLEITQFICRRESTYG